MTPPSSTPCREGNETATLAHRRLDLFLELVVERADVIATAIVTALVLTILAKIGGKA